jgi:response regulator RpfG family c-di-GMP phosphodiesterase
MEVLKRVIKKTNSELTEKVAELFKENEAIKEKHEAIKVRNRELIRENMKLYRQLRELRLQLKKFENSGEEQTGLDALANLATTIIEVTDSPTKHTQVRKSARIKATTAKKT